MGDQPRVDAEVCADGLVPGHLTRRPIITCDPVEGFTPEMDACGNVLEPDDPSIYETAEGVSCHIHPLVLLTQHPELWATWRRFSSGLHHMVTWERYREWSNFELVCWEALTAASRRKKDRDKPEEAGVDPEEAARQFVTMRSLGRV